MVLDTEHKNREKLKRIRYESTRSSDFGDISEVSGSRILNPLESLRSLPNPGLCELTEAIIYWSQEQFGVEEFIEARQEFFNLTGRVFPDDYFYHQRIAYFLDFFTFQRPVQSRNRGEDQASTPFRQFVCSAFFTDENLTESQQKRFYDLANFRHSLFKIIRVKKNKLALRDLFSDDKIEVSDPLNEILFQGLPPNAIYQGFLFSLDEKIHLSQGLLLHPASASRIIVRGVNKLKKTPPFNQMKYLAGLAKHNLTYIRHKKAEAKTIYSQPVS